MSIVSKLFLAGSGFTAAGIILYVCWLQELERRSLHKGVILDVANQERMKENLRVMQQSQDLEKYLKQEAENRIST